MKSQVSVIMPAYNAERFIGDAIESILSQTLRNYELIIIDDGSEDRTYDIISQYARKDNRIRVIRQNNSGISNTLNRGIAEARSPWVAIMHADDVALPQRLEKQLQATQANPNVVVWGTYAYHISSRGKILSISQTGPISENEFHERRRIGELMIVLHPSAFIKKEIVQRVGGYNPDFDGSEDLELFDRMAEHGAMVALPEPLICYRIHSSSISMNRFFLMRKFIRYIKYRQLARLNNQFCGSFNEFQKEYKRAPVLKRWRRSLDDLSQFYYRNAGLNYGEERVGKALFQFMLSTVLNPFYAIPRLKKQMFAKQMRSGIKNSQASMLA